MTTATLPSIEITPGARAKFTEFLAAEEEDGLAVRLQVSRRGARSFHYQLDLLPADERTEDLHELDYDDFTLLVDTDSAPLIDGATIDFVKRGLESGFRFENPHAEWQDPTARAVQRVLDEEINPAVAGHGGRVELLDVRGNTAYIQLAGGCQGCGMADVTLKQGIEVSIKQAVPAIEEVLDTTDHAAGENPYFQGGAGDSPF